MDWFIAIMIFFSFLFYIFLPIFLFLMIPSIIIELYKLIKSFFIYLKINKKKMGKWEKVLGDYTLAMMGYDPEEEDYIYICSVCGAEVSERKEECPNCHSIMEGDYNDF